MIRCPETGAFEFRFFSHVWGPEVNTAASQIYAVEGSCYVLAACAVTDQRTFDAATGGDPKKIALLKQRTHKSGGRFAMIYGSDGRELCERIPDDQEGILYADLDPAMITIAKGAADPVGHYGRGDALQLVHNKARRTLVTSIGAVTEQKPIPLDDDAE